MPANEVAALIAQHAATKSGGEDFVVVFAAMGITDRETDFFLEAFEAGYAFASETEQKSG